MAKSGAVWGIDIGQCALKAMRCRAHDENGKQVIVEAFDYIEYPKILSQAGAEPDELIADALKQFLSRNTVRGDQVAMSVSGQSGLARFIKLPPVEAKKIPDIVRYEARQQIPFDLNDVIWDYQRMGGGSEEEGFALETEVGLFAMKRDAVFRALEPFQKAGIEIDFIQLTPLALYNYLLFDQLHDLPTPDEYDPEDPPESTIILSMGTDSTDLVVTNGFRVWQRSIPLGGNHFTRALTKELKLTFAKAEHLKRNAKAAQDPKAIFQAMRPVFSDLLTELQRSIGFFSSIDRAAKISRIAALGNATKLPGLRRYLAQNLGFEVDRIEKFDRLAGSEVLSAPAFQENVGSFGVCYGLVLQALGKSGLRTNLLPREIIHDRLIRQKKPWALAAAAILLLGLGIGFGTLSRALSGVTDPDWDPQMSKASHTASRASQFVSGKTAAEGQFNNIDAIGKTLIGNVEGRVRWLEMLRMLNECLPSEPEGNRAEEVAERNELHVTNVEAQHVPDLAAWFATVRPWYEPPEEEPAPDAAAGDPVAGDPGAAGGEVPVEDPGPSGPGWVVVVSGFHYHNLHDPNRSDFGDQYVRDKLIKNLHDAQVDLPNAARTGMDTVSADEFGFGYPVSITSKKFYPHPEENPYTKIDSKAAQGGNTAPPPDSTKHLLRFDFRVQFCWIPTTPSEREAAREAEEDADPQSNGGAAN
ncbi:MAG: type IV pilus assembly protein PilM [Thermoguttaceae bacterium]